MVTISEYLKVIHVFMLFINVYINLIFILNNLCIMKCLQLDNLTISLLNDIISSMFFLIYLLSLFPTLISSTSCGLSIFVLVTLTLLSFPIMRAFADGLFISTFMVYWCVWLIVCMNLVPTSV